MTVDSDIMPGQEEITQALNAFSTLTWPEVITAALVLVVGYIVGKVLTSALRRMIRAGKLEKTLGGFLVTFVKVLMTFVVGIMAADKLGLPVTSLVAVMSMFALAVSLSVQNVLSNLVNGIVILATKPFKAGDFIETGGVSGTVESIDLVYTHLVTIDNRLILLPNSTVTGAQVINYSDKPWRRMEIPVLVGYEVSDGQMIAALLEAASRVEGTSEVADKPPQALLSSYEATGLKFVLRVWADRDRYWDVNQALLRQIRMTLKEKGIQMTYGSQRLFLSREEDPAGSR